MSSGGTVTSVPRPRLQAVMIAIAVTFMAARFDAVFFRLLEQTALRIDGSELGPDSYYPSMTVRDTAFLVFGMLLVASHPKRSGISFGTRQNAGKAIAVCVMVIAGVLAYRFVINGGAFDDWVYTWSIWTISPIAQELVFSGFILGLLGEHFPRRWHHALPITTGVIISAVLFGMWHFINDFIFFQRDMGYVAFRFAYTAVGWIPYAMSRLWTGSIMYAVATHIVVNFIVLGL